MALSDISQNTWNTVLHESKIVEEGSGKEKTEMDLKALPINIYLKIMEKMPPRSFARLRRTCSLMDNFAEQHRASVGAYHGKKIIFDGSNRFSMAVFINIADDYNIRIADPYKRISGISFRGIALINCGRISQKEQILDVLKDTKNRFFRPMIINELRKSLMNVHLTSLPTHHFIKILEKMSPRSFTRFRRTCKFMDKFAEENRMHIGVYHDNKIIFDGSKYVAVYVNTADGRNKRLDYPYERISGFSFRGIVLTKIDRLEQKQAILHILEHTKNRFFRMDIGRCETIEKHNSVLAYIRPKVLRLTSLCSHSMDLLESSGDILESIRFDRCLNKEEYFLPGFIYRFAINFRLVHFVSYWDILPAIIRDWKADREPRKLKWLKFEHSGNYCSYLSIAHLHRLRSQLLDGIPHDVKFANRVKFLDYGKERRTVCVSIPRDDGKVALLALSLRFPVDISLCKKVVCIDFLPSFEGDFETYSLETNHFPSMYTGHQMACRLVNPDLEDEFNC